MQLARSDSRRLQAKRASGADEVGLEDRQRRITDSAMSCPDGDGASNSGGHREEMEEEHGI